MAAGNVETCAYYSDHGLLPGPIRRPSPNPVIR